MADSDDDGKLGYKLMATVAALIGALVARKSLAFAVRLRAVDRTLTAEEVAAVRAAAVAEAERRCGATLRGA